MNKELNIKAALFDQDGVVLDTEGQYTLFYEQIGREYHPEVPDFAYRIKGQTLAEIFDRWFPDVQQQQEVRRRLDEWERNMNYTFIAGAKEFIESLRQRGVPTALVTSSNLEKMKSVYRAIPEFTSLFDAILTAEDMTKSKPDPEGFITAAHRLHVEPQEAWVFEDSINGLHAARSSGAYVVGLATTNPRSKVQSLADMVIDDFRDFIDA
jgi:HAD superfamily hydrolase (TIGR01509 family)